jgi:hypothetical protein
MRFLLAPPRAEDARRLPNYSSDLMTKHFVVMAIVIYGLNADVCT